MKPREEIENAGSAKSNPKPSEDLDRYPEETVIDAMLESDSGDDIPPSDEEVFSRPADPRKEERSEPRK